MGVDYSAVSAGSSALATQAASKPMLHTFSSADMLVVENFNNGL
jgi:hypothetical protein